MNVLFRIFIFSSQQKCMTKICMYRTIFEGMYLLELSTNASFSFSNSSTNPIKSESHLFLPVITVNC